MKLWWISQSKHTGYDTYDNAVVAAETEEEAKMMHPSNGLDIDQECICRTWVSDPEDVTCAYIGEAKEGTQKSVLSASFRAG